MQITDISEAKADKPVVKIVPYDLDETPRELGAGNWKGKIWMVDDFNKAF